MPISLQKYLYADVSPTNLVDPSGMSTLLELGATTTLYSTIIGASFGAASGIISGGDWRSILLSTARGAVGGAAAGLALGFASPLIGAAIGSAVGIGFWGGVLAGVVGGGVSGASGNLAFQTFNIITGEQEELEIDSLVVATLWGMTFGGVFLRSAAPSAGQEVTRWSPNASQGFQAGRTYWVQLGRNNPLNWELTGRGSLARYVGQPVYVRGSSVSVSVIKAEQLTYPAGRELWKGLLGQRMYTP